MDHPAIFSATLGLSHPWHIVSVTFGGEGNRMDISLDVYLGNLFTCPTCGTQKAPSFSEAEVWFHEDFFRYATYLHARVPRIECCDVIVAAERPWSRSGSKFGRLLRNQGATVSIPREAICPPPSANLRSAGGLNPDQEPAENPLQTGRQLLTEI
jgi:hypothetical protein